MTINQQDPRLTAYLLGELDAAEQRLIAEALQKDPALQKTLEQLKKTIALVKSELAEEPLPQLKTQQRQQLKAQWQGPKAPWWNFFKTRQGLGFGLAGGLVTATFVVMLATHTEDQKLPEPILSHEKTGLPAGAPSPSVVAEQEEGLTPGFDGMKSQPMVAGSQMRDGTTGADSPDDLDRYKGPFNTESYEHIDENPFILVGQDPLSTFSIDVDTASYANVRRFINNGQLPSPDAVRIEELINYFSYDYAKPQDTDPFSVNLEVTASPWHKDYRLVRIGLQGRDIQWGKRPASNLVFLLDVSGSMDEPNKLPLLKKSMKLLVEELGKNDRVAIAVYAGASGLVLPSTPVSEKGKILEALERLQAGGSTNGGEGIELAYQLAAKNFIKDGINRIILATDGDFNVGVTSEGDLTRLIEQKAKTGVFLTTLGFGMGNYQDTTLEKLADKGNGNYAYIDTLNEAKKVLVGEIGGTLVTIAKDVKIQVEFNPAQVTAYRLIGYENRLLRHQDFNDDTKDAGEIGAGHRVTALYEIVPVGATIDLPGVDPLKYQPSAATGFVTSNELLTVKLRYKKPDGDKSQKLEYTLADDKKGLGEASADLRFQVAVASFGMLLRNSEQKGAIDYQQVIKLAESGLGQDTHGYRQEFIQLVRQAQSLQN